MKKFTFFLLVILFRVSFADPICSYDQYDRIKCILFPNLGSIEYLYDDALLKQVMRISNFGDILYTHSYSYNKEGKLISENLIGGLGQINYTFDPIHHILQIDSPYSSELCYYDTENHLIKHKLGDDLYEYSYDSLNGLITTDQDIPSIYNKQGNLVYKLSSKGNFCFNYDDDNQLISVITPNCKVLFSYDNFGKRLSKTVQYTDHRTYETYLYIDQNELGIFDEKGTYSQ